MSTILNANLVADILTSKMPLSDSFNRAKGASERPGVHHGFELSYLDGSNWPNKNYSTNVLKINPGKAVVAATLSNSQSYRDDVLLTASLSAFISIDLGALGISAGDVNTYWVILKVIYVAPDVATDSGLVRNIGTQQAEIEILQATTGPAYANGLGVVLGKFCRASKYLETIGDHAFSNSDIVLENASGDLPNILKESTNLGINIKGMVYSAASNLKKHIRISNVTDPAVAATLGSSVLPLAGITNAIAANATAVGSWALPVNWVTDSLNNIVVTKGIYHDVEKFELFNCRFANSAGFAFHRTPGHNKIAEWLLTAQQDKIITEAEVKDLTDYGSRQFIFDGQGSVFEGDLTIDLVLDFVGEAHNCLYKIFIRNLKVLGNLTINYGQSILGMAGGAMGIIETDNVQVYGATSRIRPWPSVAEGNNKDDAVSNTAYNALWGGSKTLEFYLNNAGNIVFTNYNQSPGPGELNSWRLDSGLGDVWTSGILIPIYLHAKRDGGGSNMNMGGNPWIAEGTEGGIVLKNSTVFSEILASNKFRTPRIKIQNCKYQVKSAGIDAYRYLVKPDFIQAGDGVYTLDEYAIQQYTQDVSVKRNLFVRGLLSVLATITSAQGILSLAGNISSLAGNVTAYLKVIAGGNVEAGAKVTAAGNVEAGANVLALNDITALNNVNTEAGSVNSAVDVNAQNNVNAVNGSVNAAANVIAGNRVQGVEAKVDNLAAKTAAIYPAPAFIKLNNLLKISHLQDMTMGQVPAPQYYAEAQPIRRRNVEVKILAGASVALSFGTLEPRGNAYILYAFHMTSADNPVWKIITAVLQDDTPYYFTDLAASGAVMSLANTSGPYLINSTGYVTRLFNPRTHDIWVVGEIMHY